MRRSLWRAQGRTLQDKGWAPLRHWTLWLVLLVLADIVFYVILTPIWLGLRGAAWLAELRSRRSRGK